MATPAPFHSPNIDGTSWRPLTWLDASKGDLVVASHQGEVLAIGAVDEFTSDGGIIWIRHQASGERQLFVAADGVDLWRQR